MKNILKKQIGESYEEVPRNINRGEYIRFDLPIKKNSEIPIKEDFYKVVGHSRQGVMLKKYKCKETWILPYTNLKIKCDVVSNEEFKKIPNMKQI